MIANNEMQLKAKIKTMARKMGFNKNCNIISHPHFK